MRQKSGWLSAMFLLGACVGSIDNPDIFDPSSEQSMNTRLCEEGVDVFATIIQPKCANAGCHDAVAKSNGLDLSEADFAKHLVGLPSTCEERPYINPATLTGGFFFDKLVKTPPPCGGQQMPVTGAKLSKEELGCLRQHFRDVGPMYLTESGQ